MLSKTEWFLKLAEENPNLPIIPVLNGEVIDKESSYKIFGSNRWFGSLGDAEILMYIKGNKNVHIYGDCNFEEALIDCGVYTREEIKKVSAEDLENAFDKLPWTNAILLNIECADE